MSYLALTMQALAGVEAVRPVAPAVIISVVFAALARWVRGVTRRGRHCRGGDLLLVVPGSGIGGVPGAGFGIRADLAWHSVRLSAKGKVRNRRTAGWQNRFAGTG